MNVIAVGRKISMDENTHTQHLIKNMLDKIKYWIHCKRWEIRINKLIRDGYITHYYEPIKCTSCDYKSLYWKNTDMMDNIVMEKSVKCNYCGKQVGYWITGYWDNTIYEP